MGRATRTWPTAASGPKTRPEQARKIYCKEIVTISADDDPMGECEEQKGVFSSGFSIHVGDLGPIHPFTFIPTACGEASAAAAQPRFGAARGAAATRSLRGSGRGYEYE